MDKVNLELDDIQGIILRTYGSKKEAAFFFLTVTDVVLAKKWMGSVIDKITTTDTKGSEIYFNLAISCIGMSVLGFTPDVMATFPSEFTDGPLSEHKLRMLGDTRVNAPDKWAWGKPDTANQMHLLAMVYANTPEELKNYVSDLETAWSHSGISIYEPFETALYADNKEHFGYRDGISQPTVAGYRPDRHKTGYLVDDNVVKAGEFVLGYENMYNVYPTSPMISDDATDMLEPSPLDKTKKDLGRNGSYLAFRQLEENVKGFWDFVRNSAINHYGGDTSLETMEHIGAKMFGRFTNGTPITTHDNMTNEAQDTSNDFYYAAHDYEGFKCPIGSHARRANPRDAFNAKPKNSIELSKKHRLIRRARPYGPPLAESMQLKDILDAQPDDKKRGIYFICFNADYARQFEFMQQAWIANPKYENFFADPDPFIGNSELAHDGTPQYFTIPDKPVRKRLKGVDTFVTTKGSAYFFMPGKKALKYIAERK